jgi:FAD-linked sulfhydryl oxidase
MGNSNSSPSARPFLPNPVKEHANELHNNTSTPTNNKNPDEPQDSQDCHSCSMRPDALVNNRQDSAAAAAANNSNQPCYAYSHSGCPLNRAELGRASWAYLHTLAAFYPEKPSRELSDGMASFMYQYSAYYPCNYCADRTNEELDRNPPRTSSQRDFSLWMCEIHNEVNERLNKPQFDCSKINERWRDGINTGECNRE